jgi:integrase
MGVDVVNESGQKLVIAAGAARRVKVKGLTRIGEWYYFRPAQVGGKRPPRIALGTKVFEKAVVLALQMKQVRPAAFTPGTLAFERERWLVKREHLSRWTRDSDVSVLRLFAQFMGDETPVSLVTRLRVEQWVRKLREDGLSEATVKTYLLRLKGFFGWLVSQEVLSRSPLEAVKLPVVRKTRAERFLTREQRDGLIERCEREDLRIMLMLGFHAGLRLREMLEARVEWLRFWPGGGEVCVMATSTFTPKDKEARRIPMNDRLHEFLLAQEFEGPFLVRPDVGHAKHKYRWEPRKPFERLVVAAGLPWVGWHTLRHTFATLLVQGGCPIATVAQWLGDGIEVTFKNYVGYAPVREHVNAGL